MKISLIAGTLFALMISLAGCRKHGQGSELASSGRRIGHYKGITVVDSTIKQRIVVRSGYFDLLPFLDSFSLEGLPALLGAYDGRPGNSTFQNAAPNAVNTMLWEIVMEGAATAIAEEGCSSRLGWLESHFRQVVKTICDWPAATADHSETLREFWLALMRYDAPQAEMEAWVAQMSILPVGSETTLTGVPLVKDLTQSILMNPYFLFEQ